MSDTCEPNQDHICEECGESEDDCLDFDVLSVNEASDIARDLTTAWIQSSGGASHLSEEEVASFYKTLYQVARFPNLYEDDVDDEDEEDEEDEEDVVKG